MNQVAARYWKNLFLLQRVFCKTSITLLSLKGQPRRLRKFVEAAAAAPKYGVDEMTFEAEEGTIPVYRPPKLVRAWEILEVPQSVAAIFSLLESMSQLMAFLPQDLSVDVAKALPKKKHVLRPPIKPPSRRMRRRARGMRMAAGSPARPEPPQMAVSSLPTFYIAVNPLCRACHSSGLQLQIMSHCNTQLLPLKLFSICFSLLSRSALEHWHVSEAIHTTQTLRK